MYSRKKNLRKGEVSHDGGNVSSRRSEYVMAKEVGMLQGLKEAPLSNEGYDHHFDEGSTGLWTISYLCVRGWARR